MKKVIHVFLFIFLSGKLFCQDGTTTKITIFQPEAANLDDQQINKYRNLIKWNYSLLTRGVFLMNYEYSFSDKFTVEGGLGLTYRDYIFEWIKQDVFTDYTGAKANFCGEAAIRFYPREHNDFEGVYLSPVISYRKYSFNNQEERYSTVVGYNSTFLPGYSFLDFQFKFGYQYEGWLSWDVVSEFYIGFAYRNVTFKYYEQQEPAPGSSFSYYTYKATTKKESYPHPLLGFKLGFIL